MTQNDFLECDACRAKPGAPTLCRGCISNRDLINTLRRLAETDALTMDFINRWKENPGIDQVLRNRIEFINSVLDK